MEIVTIGVVVVIITLLLFKPKRRVSDTGIRLQKLT
jgi:hypothetical protein